MDYLSRGKLRIRRIADSRAKLCKASCDFMDCKASGDFMDSSSRGLQAADSTHGQPLVVTRDCNASCGLDFMDCFFSKIAIRGYQPLILFAHHAHGPK